MAIKKVNETVDILTREIAQAEISPGKYQRFSKRLDHALVAINKMAGLCEKAFTENLKEKVVQGHGDLLNAFVKKQISEIKEESSLLKEGRLSLQRMKKHEMHIDELDKNHRLSPPERRDIADVKRALLEAKEKLEGKQPTVRHFDILANQKNVRYVEKIELLPGEVEELLDIARAVYNRDLSQAKRRYATLPSDHKRRFEKHMQNLMAKPFVDTLQTMQGMIATVNELVENGEGYPTSDGIDQFFIGLSQVTAEENAEGKVFSFPPQASSGG